MIEILEGEEEQASRLIDERDELIKLRLENHRLMDRSWINMEWKI